MTLLWGSVHYRFRIAFFNLRKLVKPKLSLFFYEYAELRTLAIHKEEATWYVTILNDVQNSFTRSHETAINTSFNEDTTKNLFDESNILPIRWF